MPMGMFGTPDPNLDGLYEPWMDCLWTIEMPVNRAINLTFNSFNVEDHYSCSYDYVQVTQHTCTSWPDVTVRKQTEWP